ncbi:MAG: cytidine deaminase [Firmicutes bacterium]|nr:cytidine deaminase [Bacillota bacterium]
MSVAANAAPADRGTQPATAVPEFKAHGRGLSESERLLLEAAFLARERAYAPYSGFKVGAAVMCSEGRLASGCNIENASYGLTVCAERVAVFSAVSSGCASIEVIAVVADCPEPVTPCGACRQVLAEFAPKAVVLMANLEGRVAVSTVDSLLPGAFSLR